MIRWSPLWGKHARRGGTWLFTQRSPGFFYALCAALLFGASTPAAKFLLPGANPWLVAGLLYLGSGIGLSLTRILIRASGRTEQQGSGFTRQDFPWLLGASLFGGLAGPLLLMNGLARTDAATASLLLNIEGVFTALLAWFVFKENFDRRIALGMVLILLGGGLLSWGGRASVASLEGPAFIVAACLAWAIDNNFTKKISGNDAVQIVLFKSFTAGLTNVGLALALGAALPAAGHAMAIGIVGFLGYGLSLVCFVIALRHIGTSRTGAFFSLAPFAGALISVAFLGESLTPLLGLAAALMAGGVWLHLTEHHSHDHHHAEEEHSHAHIHDEHHDHAHEPGSAPSTAGAAHFHRHQHSALKHSHAHFPDLHHHHGHSHGN